MVNKLEDIKLEQQAPTKYSEEELQNIKDWISHSLTQNLALHLKEIIETEKKNWLYGGYISDDKKSLGDFNAGYSKGLLYILDFIESGGVNGIAK